MLFCNAGTLGLPLDQLTAQGLDMSYGVMVLGHVYLTQCLVSFVDDDCEVQLLT